ncbi:fungal-specific transcription factor domain-containing protein [Fusarium flagelliforme]|uniref:fungal-specific transcription factor domain-containing protein n=1 Tax=Fusarium flagelliforme TaxID=2675880 RepID=UPI001E8D0DC8|nr:fungal-specific transcription factor domain-containing protein [Fusarium flagelliforme]KAH7174343.1 fungal-specific transcription factor domain-containing protein [Fusarium flagelliforme]
MTSISGPSVAEEEANSTLSGSSGDESRTVGPSKKRRREKHQKISCEMCKTRKVKCDRAEPACSWCARHNKACVYLERQKPGAARNGFSIELEAKVNRIDALLQALGRRVEEHIVQDHSPVVSPGANVNGYGSTIDSRITPATLPRQSSFSQAKSPAVTSPWQVNNSQNGPSSGQIQQHGTSAGTPAQTNNISTPSAIPRNPSIQSYTIDLPPHDIIYSLVDLYFKHCGTWCPILERKTIFATFFGSTSMEEPDRILLYAIVATTLRFLKDPRLSPEMSAYYHSVAKHTVQLYAMEHTTVPALRALVIITLDELGTSNGPRGWNLLSLLAQNARQLGLCEESSVFLSAEASEVTHTASSHRVSASKPESWIEDEGRRRLYWMIYLLDRYATIATPTFDFILSDTKINRFLPCSYDLFSKNVPVETRSLSACNNKQSPIMTYLVNKPENLGSFAYHCEILVILSRIHEFLKMPVDVTSASDMAEWRNTYRNLDRTLDGWLQSLPSEYSKISALCHSDPASRVANWFMLHSAYVTAAVRLHSSAAYPTVRSHIFVPSHYAMQRCLSAVQSLGDITRDVLEADGLNLLGPSFAFSLWVAARLLLVHAATVGCTVDSQIDFFIETLRDVGQHWEVANNYSKILQRVVQRARQGDMGFSAMRRSAYDLVTLTSTARHSGLEATSTQATSLSELDNIDVFEFFNYPRASSSSNAQSQLQLQPIRTQESRSNGAPDPEADWLAFGSPFT